MTPAFALFVGFQIAAFAGLFFWNLYLHNKLRATRGRGGEVISAQPQVPPASVAAESPGVTGHPESASLPDLREREWQRRLAQAEHQHQLVQGELASLSYSVSHDLRAPLRAIDGFSQALAEDYGHALDTTAQGYLQRVRANARHMASLIEDLLSLSRLARAPMQREIVELGPLAESIMAALHKSDPERVVSLDIQPGLRANADRTLLETALQHLFGNAWKFTARRPVAHVSLRANTLTQENGEPETVYELRDDGAGFDMNYAGKLFGAFQRMHTVDEFSGNGIGLASVQRIIRRHDGRVWADARPDQGTAIFFTIGAQGECGGAAAHDGPDVNGLETAKLSQDARVSLTSSQAL